jgi:hypothetical protein
MQRKTQSKTQMRWLVLGLLALCSCSDPLQSSADETKAAAAHRVQRQAAYQLRREKELIPCGTGSQMMGSIEMLALSFQYFKALPIEEGRRLAIDAKNTFLNVINSDEKIRPYLARYPFNANNVDIRIFFYQEDFKDVPLGFLKSLSAIDDHISYSVAVSNGSSSSKNFKETYEEALKYLHQNNKSKSSAMTSDTEPQETLCPRICARFNGIMAKEISK